MNTLEELHEAIRDEIDGIWTKEPEDIRALRRGFMPSGAGVYGQYFTVLVMLGSEMRSLAIHTFSGLVSFVDSERFNLEQLKYMTKEQLRVTSGVLEYFGLRRFGDILNAFLKHLDAVENLSELRELLQDMFTLTNRYQMWLYQTFPWHLSVFFPKKTIGDVNLDMTISQNLEKEVA